MGPEMADAKERNSIINKGISISYYINKKIKIDIVKIISIQSKIIDKIENKIKYIYIKNHIDFIIEKIDFYYINKDYHLYDAVGIDIMIN
jgi:pantothenate kinase type III